MTRLYHFCCSHSAYAIQREGLLRPTPVPWKRYDAELRKHMWPTSGLRNAPRVVWLTDLPALRDPDVVGLTSATIGCDRTEYRAVVETDRAERWNVWASRHRANPVWRATLEEYGWADTWWVASVPLQIEEIAAVRVSVPLPEKGETT